MAWTSDSCCTKIAAKRGASPFGSPLNGYCKSDSVVVSYFVFTSNRRGFMMALTWSLLALPSLLAGAHAMTAAEAAAIAGSYAANIKV